MSGSRFLPPVSLLLALTSTELGCSRPSNDAALAPNTPADEASAGPASLVNPFVGTDGHGHTYPGAVWPFGMVQLSPDTRLDGWDGCSGYHYRDLSIYGFSHTHLSGTGIADYADVLFMPTTKARVDAVDVAEAHPFALGFQHHDEHAAPGEYSVRLAAIDTRVDLTVTPRVGIHRYTFPADVQPAVYVDLRHRDTVLDAELIRVGPRELAGRRRSSSWAKDQHVYFVARFSRDILGWRNFGGSAWAGESARGEDVRVALEFAASPKPLIVKVGISAVDIDGARKNLDAEAPHFDFEAYRRQARAQWNDQLDAIALDGGTLAQQRTFYTALYHTMVAPNLFEDVDGRYRGTDGAIHDSPDHEHYTVFSLWDTFRATHPLYTILEPRRTSEFVRTMLAHDRDGGSLPVWELAGNETGTMIGYHSVPVIVDAWRKGLRDFDGEQALAAMVRAADRDHLGLAAYREFGYIPLSAEPESVSKTLEYAYDDWCIAEMARDLGQDDVAERFAERAQFWTNLFDPESGLLRPRRNGGWLRPFDPREVNVAFTEANAWQYGFFVPHDIGGLVTQHGGATQLAAKLDELFEAPSETTGRDQVDITGLIGQYAHGNEPSHHIAYLYPYTGQAHQTQRRVRQIVDELYSDRPDGLSGNEDCGQMSAWYVFSALGFYPVTPGNNTYVIGTPLFPRASVALPSGNTFVIEAPAVSGENIYVQSARLNGQSLEQAVLRHEDILAGGVLAFTMGSSPNPHWGRIEPPRPLASTTPSLVQSPVLAPTDPSFADEMTLTMRAPGPNAVVHYTLDGSAVSTASPRYEGPISLRATTTVRAIAVANGRVSRAVVGTFNKRPNWAVELKHAYQPQYSAGGPEGLIDGVNGSEEWRLGHWQGYLSDFEAVIDLGRARRISHVSSGYLQDANAWIWMPREVEYAVSNDGKNFRVVGSATHDVPERDVTNRYVRRLGIDVSRLRARYVRVRARNFGTIPAWHLGHGEQAHLFVDEIEIR